MFRKSIDVEEIYYLKNINKINKLIKNYKYILLPKFNCIYKVIKGELENNIIDEESIRIKTTGEIVLYYKYNDNSYFEEPLSKVYYKKHKLIRKVLPKRFLKSVMLINYD